ncbi:MAG TPA: HemK/PrmC family methyltransferase [Candidatus Dormibacteraeota bacterium]
MSRITPDHVREATRRLSAAGCIAAPEEAEELVAAALGDPVRLAAMVDRRTVGEPLAWIKGTVTFCGCQIKVASGVFVPRWLSEPLAERAAELLPPSGRAIDLGTGSGAVARVLMERRPRALVIGTETDLLAIECARENGVTVMVGDLFQGVPATWRRLVDVVVGILPYVPTDEIEYLPRDVRAFEPLTALEGGSDGLAVVRRAAVEAAEWLRDGGSLLLAIGGKQAEALGPVLGEAGFGPMRVMTDEDGDVRGVEAMAGAAQPTA